MLKKTILILFILSNMTIAEASDVGHGGDVVVCFKDQEVKERVKKILFKNRETPYPEDPFTTDVLNNIVSIKLLDLWPKQNDIFSGKPYEPIRSDKSYQVIYKEISDLILIKSSFIQTLKFAEENLPPGSWIAVNSSVVEIDDSEQGHTLPQNCLLVQLGLQRPRTSSSFDDTSLFKFNKAAEVVYDVRLFDKMEEVHKSAFIFHEVIYFLAKLEGHNDSRATRMIVRLLFSSDFHALSADIFHAVLTRNGFIIGYGKPTSIYDRFQGRQLPVIDPQWYENGILRQWKLIVPVQLILPSGIEVEVMANSEIYFFENGAL